MRGLRARPAAEIDPRPSFAAQGARGQSRRRLCAAAPRRSSTSASIPALDRQIALVAELRGRAAARCRRLAAAAGRRILCRRGRNATTTTTCRPRRSTSSASTQVAEIQPRARRDPARPGHDRRRRRRPARPRSTAIRASSIPNTDEGRAELIADLNRQITEIDAAAAARLRHPGPGPGRGHARAADSSRTARPTAITIAPPLDGSRPAIYYINLKDTARLAEIRPAAR